MSKKIGLLKYCESTENQSLTVKRSLIELSTNYNIHNFKAVSKFLSPNEQYWQWNSGTICALGALGSLSAWVQILATVWVKTGHPLHVMVSK